MYVEGAHISVESAEEKNVALVAGLAKRNKAFFSALHWIKKGIVLYVFLK